MGHGRQHVKPSTSSWHSRASVAKTLLVPQNEVAGLYAAVRYLPPSSGNLLASKKGAMQRPRRARVLSSSADMLSVVGISVMATETQPRPPRASQ